MCRDGALGLDRDIELDAGCDAVVGQIVQFHNVGNHIPGIPIRGKLFRQPP